MMEYVNNLLGPHAPAVIQFVKYALGGVAATSVDIAVFYFLSWLVIPALRENDPMVRLLRLRVRPVSEAARPRRFIINTALAFCVSNFVAYLINILWVFKAGKYAWYVELAMFYAVSGISLFIGTFLGWLLIKRLHFSTTFSYVTKMISSLLINFVCRKFIIFKG